ncbi:hypothetical protein D3C84_1254520 [compost metagenome]
MDLSEDGFDDGLAPCVDGPAPLGFEFPGHAFFQRGVARDPATGCLGDLFAVFEPAGRDEELGASGALGLDLPDVFEVGG